jgi:DNA modification methylase
VKEEAQGKAREMGSALTAPPRATWQVIQGDAVERLRALPDESVQTCVTSPPYWNLRDYGVDGQIGLEATPEEWVTSLVAVFSEVRRVLRCDGTVWLNVGDAYADRANCRSDGQSHRRDRRDVVPGKKNSIANGRKQKDLIGLPWMLAFALRGDGWYLRSEVIWAKRNGLPDGRAAYDRPDRSHEHIFLLSARPRYFYDAAAIREDSEPDQEDHNRLYAREYAVATASAQDRQPGNTNHVGIHSRPGPGGRNRRSVWRESVHRYPGAHFATFPPKLIEPCVLAGSPPGQTVLDPFTGAGTTGLVALRHDRSFIGIELNEDYCELARQRIRDDAPLLNVPAEAA